jgi:hypothetical protein
MSSIDPDLAAFIETAAERIARRHTEQLAANVETAIRAAIQALVDQINRANQTLVAHIAPLEQIRGHLTEATIIVRDEDGEIKRTEKYRTA